MRETTFFHFSNLFYTKLPFPLPCIARHFWHLRDWAWPSRAAYANSRLIAAGRRSVVRGSNAAVDREEKKDQFSLSIYPQLESLSCTSIFLDSPSTLLWMTSFSVCLSRRTLSPTSDRCHPSGAHALSDFLLSSSIFFSVSFILKRVKERRAFVQSTHELQPLWIDHKLCSLKADAIEKTIRKVSTDPEKQANFLEDFSPLSRKKHRLWRKQRATVWEGWTMKKADTTELAMERNVER